MFGKRIDEIMIYERWIDVSCFFYSSLGETMKGRIVSQTIHQISKRKFEFVNYFVFKLRYYPCSVTQLANDKIITEL